MIEFRNLTKSFPVNGGEKTICRNLNMVIPQKTSVALLGRNGAGKSTLLKLISGTMDPTAGSVIRRGRMSWPVGFAGSFHGELTGSQNTKFVARIYGMDTDEMLNFVEDFAGLGAHFQMPFRTYSAGMKSRLAFGVSMAVPFDIYLVDEVTSVGDAAFRKKSSEVLQARLAEAGAFVVSHSMEMLRKHCDVGLVLEDGKATYFDDLESAIAQHQRNML